MGYEIREPYEGEISYFEQNPEVAGMAAEDGRITLNPYTDISPEEKMSVAKNEAIRLWMRENNVVPVLKLTKDQKKMFEGTEYGEQGNEKFLKQSIVARILSGDPSANATKHQFDQAKKIEKKMLNSLKKIGR